MYKGIGDPRFVVKLKADGSTVETIDISQLYILDRQDLSHEERYDLDEENPLTNEIIPESLGWRYKERMSLAVSDTADSFSVFIAKQKQTATENAITKVLRIEEYSDEIEDTTGDDKYEIYFWPHKDAMDAGLLDDPYLVKVDVESLSSSNRKSNNCTVLIYGIELTTQVWTDFTTVGTAFTGAYSNGYSSGFDI